MRLTALALLLTAALHAQTNVPFDAARWQLIGDFPHEGFGTDTLGLHGGDVLLKDVSLADGVLEVDILPATRAGFAGLIFRAASGDELELVYLRLHKSGQPDAIQYTPRYNGMDSWQLYSGEGNIARADIPRDKPTHLKVVFEGPTAQVYVNGSDTPSLKVARLQRPYARGAIGLFGLADSKFMNFSYRELPKPAVTTLPAEPLLPGTIQAWELSQNVEPQSVAGLDPKTFPKLEWQRVPTLPSGLLDISKYRKHRGTQLTRAKSPFDGVVARAVVRSDKRRLTKIDIAYSDRATIFINGTPLFYGNLEFPSPVPLGQTIAALGAESIYAPLREGANEILVVSEEKFGGWGLQFRFPDPAGLTLPK